MTQNYIKTLTNLSVKDLNKFKAFGCLSNEHLEIIEYILKNFKCFISGGFASSFHQEFYNLTQNGSYQIWGDVDFFLLMKKKEKLHQIG